MWILNWAPAWFWIMPLLMLGMFVICILLMVRGRCRGGCCCGGNRTRFPYSESRPENGR
jgi:hypothetical protein